MSGIATQRVAYDAGILSDYALAVAGAYLQARYAESLAARAAAETVSQQSQAAGRTSGAYVQTTISFAIALFFAGVTSTC